MSLQPDPVVDGKYRIVRLLGEGAMVSAGAAHAAAGPAPSGAMAGAAPIPASVPAAGAAVAPSAGALGRSGGSPSGAGWPMAAGAQGGITSGMGQGEAASLGGPSHGSTAEGWGPTSGRNVAPAPRSSRAAVAVVAAALGLSALGAGRT